MHPYWSPSNYTLRFRLAWILQLQVVCVKKCNPSSEVAESFPLNASACNQSLQIQIYTNYTNFILCVCKKHDLKINSSTIGYVCIYPGLVRRISSRYTIWNDVTCCLMGSSHGCKVWRHHISTTTSCRTSVNHAS